MQHISHTESSSTYAKASADRSINQSRGGRISSPKLRASLEQSQDFCGLEEDTNRYDLLLLVKKVGKAAGFSTKMINLLDYYMAFTRDMDWEEGSSPIVYQSLSRTALDLGVSERQIQKLEKALFEVGALTWNDSGNHRRYGKRCPDTGAILYAYGVDLTPLAYLKTDLELKLFEKQEHDRVWMETKRQISWYRAQIRAVLAELELITDIDPPYIELVNAYNNIAVQIRTTMSLENINSRLDEHKKLYAMVTNILNVNAGGRGGGVVKLKETKKSSPKSDSLDTHYKYTKKQSSNKLDTSRDKLNCFQKTSSQNSDNKTERIEQGGKLQNQKSKPKNIPTQCGLQHITLKQLLNISSERLKAELPMEPRPMNANDFVEAAYRLNRKLGISQSSWGHACITLSRIGAAVCVILTDQANLREENRVMKPGAYCNAMVNRAKSGELKLHKSVMGKLRRDNDNERAESSNRYKG